MYVNIKKLNIIYLYGILSKYFKEFIKENLRSKMTILSPLPTFFNADDATLKQKQQFINEIFNTLTFSGSLY